MELSLFNPWHFPLVCLDLTQETCKPWMKAVSNFYRFPLAQRPALPALRVVKHESVPFESLAVGQEAKETHLMTREAIYSFADATCDLNPAHMSPEGVPPFGKPIAHGLLVGGFVSALIASKLPGPGSIYLKQAFNFRKAVFIGDEVTAMVTITAIDKERRSVTLKTVVKNQRDELVIDGEALILKAE